MALGAKHAAQNVPSATTDCSEWENVPSATTDCSEWENVPSATTDCSEWESTVVPEMSASLDQKRSLIWSTWGYQT